MAGKLFDTAMGLFNAVREWILDHFAVGISKATFQKHRDKWVFMLMNGQGRAAMEEKNLGGAQGTLSDKNEATLEVQTVNNNEGVYSLTGQGFEPCTHPPQTPPVDTPPVVVALAPVSTAIEAPQAPQAPIGKGKGKAQPTALLVTVGELVDILPDLAMAVRGLGPDHELVLDKTDYPPDQWARLTAAILA
jgi:hypothetical protein